MAAVSTGKRNQGGRTRDGADDHGHARNAVGRAGPEVPLDLLHAREVDQAQAVGVGGIAPRVKVRNRVLDLGRVAVRQEDGVHAERVEGMHGRAGGRAAADDHAARLAGRVGRRRADADGGVLRPQRLQEAVAHAEEVGVGADEGAPPVGDDGDDGVARAGGEALGADLVEVLHDFGLEGHGDAAVSGARGVDSRSTAG